MNRPSSPWATGSVTDRIHDDADDEFADVEDYDAYADYDDDDFDATTTTSGTTPITTTGAGCGWPASRASCC